MNWYLLSIFVVGVIGYALVGITTSIVYNRKTPPEGPVEPSKMVLMLAWPLIVFIAAVGWYFARSMDNTIDELIDEEVRD